MPLADVIVRRGDRGAATLPPDDVTTRFEPVITEHGPVRVPIVAVSWSQVKTAVGDHTAYSTLRGVESYFQEGGARVVLSRVVGPGATTASLDLRTADARTVLTVTAEAPGVWYEGLRIRAEAATGNDRTVTITLNDDLLASGLCTSTDDLIDLVESAGYFGRSTPGVGVWPIAVTEAALDGGDDDRANIRDPQVIAALAVMHDQLGAGSVCASGWTTVPIHRALAEHARAGPLGHNRFARADLPDVSSAAALISHVAQLRTIPDARYLQVLAGWPQTVIGGVTVPVPPSGLVTGREALADRQNAAGPGQPAAWTYGEFRTAVGVSQRWTKAEREQLLDAGITVIVQDETTGAVYPEDAITVIDPVRYPQYREVSAMRVTMAIHQQAQAVLRQRVMQTIDGKGHLAVATSGDLAAICLGWYSRNALYGDTPEEAFSVNVTADAATRRLVGNLTLRPSPSVQTVELTITQVAAGDTI